MNSAKDDCYSLIQEIAVARDGLCRAPGCCQIATAGHHIFGRKNMATAFNPRYALGMCVDCHVPWAHKEPDQFNEWVISWMGEEEYYAALRLSNSVCKHQDFKQIRAALLEVLKKYKKALTL